MTRLLIEMIKRVLRGERAVCPPDADWQKLIKLADRHKVMPFVARYADEKGVPAELKQRAALALACQGYQGRALADIRAALETAGVDFLLFKGAVTRRRYPSEDLRTMSDIDLLYKPEAHEAFCRAMRAAGFPDREAGRKNDTYRRRPFVCVEAHREMVPASSPYAAYCAGVWERARPAEGTNHTYEMTAEDEFIFCLIHLAQHFQKGGAGLRFIADVYVYDGAVRDRAYLAGELEKLGLSEFYQNISALAAHWFGDGPADPLTERIGRFVLSGGLFGTKGRSSDLAVEGGRWRFVRNACFPSYGEMRSMYPWLDGRKVLLPCAWAYRGVTGVFRRRGNVKRQMERLTAGDAEQGKKLRAFFKECGLDIREGEQR